MVHAHRGLLVALTRLVHPALAQRDVVIGDEARPAPVVLEHVHARALRVDHQRVCLVGPELDEVARHAALGGALAHGAQPGQGFRAQVFYFLARHVAGIAESGDRARAGEQQVAADQVREAVVGVDCEQRLDALKRLIELALLYGFEYLRERLFRLQRGRLAQRLRCRQGEEDEEGGKTGAEQGGDQAFQFATFSCWIRQLPSVFTSTSVFMLLALMLS